MFFPSLGCHENLWFIKERTLCSQPISYFTLKTWKKSITCLEKNWIKILTISNKYNWLVSKWPNLLNNFVYFEDYKKWHSCLLPLAWWKLQIFSRLIRTLQQKVSLYAKWIHWILSEFTSCSEQGPMKK